VGDLGAAAAAIDAANAEDPTNVVVDGEARPLALAHGTLAVEWLLHLDPDASAAQQLAARAHHLRRWQSPRGDFPAGRAGYLRWRTAAKRRHAEELGDILGAAGFTADEVARAQQLIRKEGLGTDPAAQAHEDAACLAFLATQLDAVAAQLGDEKTVEVLAKTARKMSAAGLAAAGRLALTARGAAILRAALDGRT
jgi:hypothetical protein